MAAKCVDVQLHYFVVTLIFAVISNLQNEELLPKIEVGRESSPFEDILKLFPDAHGVSKTLHLLLGTSVEVQEYRRYGAFGVIVPFSNFFVTASDSASIARSWACSTGRLRPRPSL